MPVSVSYRLDPRLKDRLAERAHDEGISEESRVTRFLDEGLKTSAHPGIVYRTGPAGRRAAVAGGPDVWEVVVATRHTRQRGDARVGATAEQLGVPEQLVRTAVAFAAVHPDEVEAMINRKRGYGQRRRAGRPLADGPWLLAGLLLFVLYCLFLLPAVLFPVRAAEWAVRFMMQTEESVKRGERGRNWPRTAPTLVTDLARPARG